MSSKKRLTKALKRKFEESGYIVEADGDLILLRREELGKWLTISVGFYRFENNKFFVDFFLSDSCEFALMYPGFPPEAYQRATNFFTPKDKETFQLDEMEFFHSKLLSNTDVDHFKHQLKKAETRFLQQEELVEKINSCEGLQERMALVDQIYTEWTSGLSVIDQTEYEDFLPQKKILREVAVYTINVLQERKYKYFNKDVIESFSKDVYWRKVMLGKGPAKKQSSL